MERSYRALCGPMMRTPAGSGIPPDVGVAQRAIIGAGVTSS
jgi:hypothetical protein